MGFPMTMLVGLTLWAAGARAQDAADSLTDSVELPRVATDLAKALRDGQAASDSLNVPRYRNREPMRAAGTPKEQVSGTAVQISPDKTTRGGGDW
jgi:hypothetical protein